MRHDQIYHHCVIWGLKSGVKVKIKNLYTILLLSLVIFGQLNAEEGLIGIDDSRLGQNINLDLTFTDESGQPVTLREASEGKPIVLALVYYNCTSICNPFLNAIVDVVNQSPTAFLPGDEYNIVAISFDPSESTELAALKKESYYNMFELNNPLTANAFRFFTSDSASIAELTESVGFHYQEDGMGGYSHASSIIILSPSGTISRYIRGLSFLPVELMVSVTNAMEGKWAPTVKKIVQFCFTEEPEGRGYYFNFLKVTGLLILLAIAITTLVLTILVNRKEPEQEQA